MAHHGDDVCGIVLVANSTLRTIPTVGISQSRIFVPAGTHIAIKLLRDLVRKMDVFRGSPKLSHFTQKFYFTIMYM
jgi:hypothetical protein